MLPGPQEGSGPGRPGRPGRGPGARHMGSTRGHQPRPHRPACQPRAPGQGGRALREPRRPAGRPAAGTHGKASAARRPHLPELGPAVPGPRPPTPRSSSWSGHELLACWPSTRASRVRTQAPRTPLGHPPGAGPPHPRAAERGHRLTAPLDSFHGDSVCKLVWGGGSEGGKRPGPWAGRSVHSGLPPLQLCQDGLPSLGRGQKLCPPPAGPGLPAQGTRGSPGPHIAHCRVGEHSRKEVPSAIPRFPGPCPAAAHPEDAPRLAASAEKSFPGGRTAWRAALPPTSAPRVPLRKLTQGLGRGAGPGRFRSPWSCPGDRQVERAGRPQGRDLGPHRADRQGGQELGHRPGGGGWGVENSHAPPASPPALSVRAGRAVCTGEPQQMPRPLPAHLRETGPASCRRAAGGRAVPTAAAAGAVPSEPAGRFLLLFSTLGTAPSGRVVRGCQDGTCQSQSKEHGGPAGHRDAIRVPGLPTGRGLPRSRQVCGQQLPGCGCLASPASHRPRPILGQLPLGPDERPYKTAEWPPAMGSMCPESTQRQGQGEETPGRARLPPAGVTAAGAPGTAAAGSP